MKTISWPVCGLFLAAAVVLPAQQGTLSGPVAGFVFDNSAHVLRPIHGVPGASLLGDALAMGVEAAQVYVSPRQDSAFVIANDQSMHLFALNGGVPTEVSLGGISGTPVKIVFSPAGTALALIAPGSARILTGLPNAPVLSGSVKVEGLFLSMSTGAHSFHTSAPALAVSDDGNYALTVAQGSVRLLSVQGQNRILMPAQADALVAFAAGGHDAAVMDPASGLTLIRDTIGAAGRQLLAPFDDGLAGAVGVAFSQDTQTVYVASSTAKAVAAFNLSGASRTAIGCNCTPETLAPMGNLFRLSELTTGPLWVLDGANAAPRTVFVPAHASN
jgi:DNA-binding beta-propeller fold protein YncE